MLALYTDLIVAAGFGDNLAGLIRSIVGPIFLIVCGLFAFKFLKDSQIMAFLTFLIVAIIVAAIIYAPAFIQNIGTGIAGELSW